MDIAYRDITTFSGKLSGEFAAYPRPGTGYDGKFSAEGVHGNLLFDRQY
jgi:hypothetical protein